MYMLTLYLILFIKAISLAYYFSFKALTLRLVYNFKSTENSTLTADVQTKSFSYLQKFIILNFII